MAFLTGHDVVEQIGQRFAQLALLKLTDGDFLFGALDVIGIDIVAYQLFLQVVNAQSQDRQSIDDAARRFGI